MGFRGGWAGVWRRAGRIPADRYWGVVRTLARLQCRANVASGTRELGHIFRFFQIFRSFHSCTEGRP
eukprot:gene10563-biopygen15638